MSSILEYLGNSATVTKREILLGAIASLMTGIVIGTYAARPKHPRHPHGAPQCPPPPMPPREPQDPGRRPPHDSGRGEKK
ncbi:MAG: hypothetical protein LUG99_14935 [Lachnospiraceae bacterium]|nr:hypothetical protein [Lachnospiraceae bacterium]